MKQPDTSPISPPPVPAQRLFQEPPAKSKSSDKTKWTVGCVGGLLAVAILAAISAVILATGPDRLEPVASIPYSKLTLGDSQNLWENLSSALLNPGPRNYSGDLMHPPESIKELEPLKARFERSMTVSWNGRSHDFYGYPFTGLEEAHKYLVPTAIPSLLRSGRPKELFPIETTGGDVLTPEKSPGDDVLAPEDLKKFLGNAKVTDVQPGADKELFNVIVGDGTVSFSVPARFAENTGWRFERCGIVDAIINAIALK